MTTLAILYLCLLLCASLHACKRPHRHRTTSQLVSLALIVMPSFNPTLLDSVHFQILTYYQHSGLMIDLREPEYCCAVFDYFLYLTDIDFSHDEQRISLDFASIIFRHESQKIAHIPRLICNFNPVSSADPVELEHL
ncbi:unnamed protein product [Protopolystoma xenopodis]|uniref:Uncharacterized protein n=1 Tax=Protopolystoma xenopodis TaxID=117903 RepID=A0A3S5C454_9PLAT|nr:unnamed protein product [Protopolystoma xenopodis]